MGRLQEQRIDLFAGAHIHNESNRIFGHEARMSARKRRIHEAIGPVTIYRQRSENKLCKCPICKNYRAAKTKGPEHSIKEEQIIENIDHRVKPANEES